jgi:2-polyprenyl-3-methyl-5-hydroxy-6-metoxy-1,4-benzoquinol methylase
MSKQEFDNYAVEYSAGMENPVKKLMAGSALDFLRPKVALLKKIALHCNPCPKLLDFGCGSGDFLSLVASECPSWELCGSDISEEMMNESRKRYGNEKRGFSLMPMDEALGTHKYDLITASCVFHHIPPGEWESSMKRLSESLNPSGMVVIFEHNPRNPLTNWVVSRTPIDQNAVLLDMREVFRLMSLAELKVTQGTSFLFGPPTWKVTQVIDGLFGWTGLGGQYFVVGKKAGE